MNVYFLLFTASAVTATISGTCAPEDKDCQSDQAVLLQHRPVVDTLPGIPDGALLLEKILIGNNSCCEDKDPLCADWAAAGECDSNAGWMWPNCPVSCDKCPHGENCDECKDLSPNCKEWAELDPSQCDTNAAWMWPNCPVSCNKCPHGDNADKCQDLHPSCASWAKDDECDNNSGWMWVNCPVSCNKCPHGDATPTTPAPTTPAPTGGWVKAEGDKCRASHEKEAGQPKCPGGWYCRPGNYCVPTPYAKGERGNFTCPTHYTYMTAEVPCYWYSVLGSGPPTYWGKDLGKGNGDRMPGCWLSANGDCGNWNPNMDRGDRIEGSYVVCELEKCTSNDMCPRSKPNCITKENHVAGTHIGSCYDMLGCDKACGRTWQFPDACNKFQCWGCDKCPGPPAQG
jgi:hypothetical protein